MGSSKHAERVFYERVLAERIEASIDQVGAAVIGIDDLAGIECTSHHVHPEIPPCQIFLERDFRGRFDGEIAVFRADGAFSARKCDVSGPAVDHELDNTERRADEFSLPDGAKASDNLVQRDAGYQIVQVRILRLGPAYFCQKLVSHPAADGKNSSSDERTDEQRIQRFDGLFHVERYAALSGSLPGIPDRRG